MGGAIERKELVMKHVMVWAWVLVGIFFFGVVAQGQWQTTGSLEAPRIHHTSTLLPSGQVLVVGGFNGPIGGRFNNSYLLSAEIYDPTTGTWTDAGHLTTPRSQHTSTLLPSGQVLVVGGRNGSGSLSSAEIYDPSTGAWSNTGHLANPRSRHTSTLLPSGQVLVVGGWNGGSLSSAEIYDPTKGTWTNAGNLANPRVDHTSTLLPSGQVLVVGGYSGGGYSDISLSAEIYNPTTGTWTEAGRPATRRFEHTSTLLPSGQVLVVGGYVGSGGSLSSAEIYDPIKGTWTDAGNLANPRRQHTSTLLPSGQVLVAGGYGSGYLSSAEIYDPSTGTWSDAGNLANPRGQHTSTLLPSGQVLVAGGQNGSNIWSSAEIYDPSTGTWSDAGNLANPREDHTSTLLPSGKVLVVGGYNGGYLSSAEIYDPSTGIWSDAGNLANPRSRHTSTLLPSGQALVVGGYGGSGAYLSSAEIYDPSTGTWSDAGHLANPRSRHTSTLLPSGRVLVVGGYSGGGGSLSSAETYDPSTGTWSDAGRLATSRYDHTSTLLPSGKVLVVGGRNGDGSLSSAELYDPSTGTRSYTGRLDIPRYDHTSTLLPWGGVFVVGGRGQETDGDYINWRSAEIYDPSTETWSDAGHLATSRARHTSTLLPSGQVLIVGGVSNGDGQSWSAEMYDPSTGTWNVAGGLGYLRFDHTSTLLPSGKVLVVGGYYGPLPSVEMYASTSPPESRKPIIQSASQIRYGEPLTITGQFRGDSESSGGNTASSAVNFPILHLRALAETAHHTLIIDPQSNFWDAPRTLTVSDLPPTIYPGPHLLTVIVAGVPSEPVLVDMECSVAITSHPVDQAVELGESATFTVQSQGGRFYQWQKNGIDIPGATEPTYTAPPISTNDTAAVYRVVVSNGCAEEYSEPAELTISEGVFPLAELIQPTGGEYWLLSSPDTPDTPNTELITWTMSDNFFICQVELALIYSESAGSCVEPLSPEHGKVLKTFGESGASCTFPGVETTSWLYTLPTELPSGTPGSSYRIRLCVTDPAGNVTQVESLDPFFITDRRNDIHTLLITHSDRIDITPELNIRLQNLINHPNVQGLLIDLADVTDLNDDFYAPWDAGEISANEVLFAQGGIHDYLLSLLDIYPKVEHLLLVGDDSVIPMTRLMDRTLLLPEVAYAPELPPGSTVQQALEANHYLSDDPLATRGSLRPHQLNGRIHLADLNIGRLVETPSEISAAIDAYVAQDGVLDLSQRAPKALVTGYDFLQDSAHSIKGIWSGVYTPEEVDGQLISSGWGVPSSGTSVEERRDLLYNALAQAPGITSLGGHATHAEEGVPGIDRYDLQGLSATDIAALDLSGCVIYAIGCHGGLPVPDEMDLPQSFLGAGAGAYLAGSGYGWGLLQGIGLSERLSVILTRELANPEPQRIGDVIRRSKAFYYDTSPRWDDYDTKVLHQPILYGFPMYIVQTDSWPPVPLTPTGRVGVTTATSNMGLPPHVVGLEINFDFTGPDVYRKFDADGNPTSECPPEGCYYELNGLVSGESDLPLEPYFRYNSSLAGTSQHGILWLGGTYLEEEGWTPVFGRLASNDSGDHGQGSTPPKIFLPPRGPQPLDRGDLPGCPAYDQEVNSLVVTTGAPAQAPGDEVGEYSLHRLDQNIELEVFYFNNLSDPNENCDRQGPSFSNGEPHTVSGTTLHWSVEVEDEAGVWRVVVVWDDEPAARWRPLELSYDTVTDRWTGSLPAADRGELTYMLQAVDNRGNVAWKELDSELPPSGVPLGLAEVFTVPIGEGEVDLELALSVPAQVEAGDAFTLVMNVLNHGPDPAHGLTVSLSLPEDGIYIFGSGDGWTCDLTPPVLDCAGALLEVGESSEIFVQLMAPGYGGTQHFNACVVAAEADPNGPACADADHLVIDESMTDLRIIKEDGGIIAMPGEPIVYSITVTNEGPNPAPDSRVVDIFPPELLNVTWSCTATVGSSCTASGSGHIDDLVDLEVYGTLIYIATAIVDPDVISGPIVNVATVEVSSAMSDFVQADNNDYVLTPTFHDYIFSDGFESGDLSTWE